MPDEINLAYLADNEFLLVCCEQGESGWRLCCSSAIWRLQDVWPRKGI